MMKIISRPSGNLIIETRKSYFKVPVRFYAFLENKKELENIKEAREDKDFFSYIPNYSNLISLIRSQKLEKIEKESIVHEYLEKAFSESKKWPKQKVNQIIDTKRVLSLAKEIDKETATWLENLLKTKEIAESSSHGDFHMENIMVDQKKQLKFIDWTRYERKSSRYFDLVDFHVFQNKNSKETWFSSWQNLYSSGVNNLSNIYIDKNHLISYALWKISQELKTLRGRGGIKKEKREKYKKIISQLKNL